MGGEKKKKISDIKFSFRLFFFKLSRNFFNFQDTSVALIKSVEFHVAVAQCSPDAQIFCIHSCSFVEVKNSKRKLVDQLKHLPHGVPGPHVPRRPLRGFLVRREGRRGIAELNELVAQQQPGVHISGVNNGSSFEKERRFFVLRF